MNRLNPKTAWLNQVKKHKQKQKGLSPFVKLDAGDVELTGSMFNSSVDFGAISGAACESIDSLTENSLTEDGGRDTVALLYKKLPIEAVVKRHSNYYDTDVGIWLPGYTETKEVFLDEYIYEADKTFVVDELWQLDDAYNYVKNGRNISDDEVYEELINRVDEVAEKFEQYLLPIFEEAAKNSAQRDYNNNLITIEDDDYRYSSHDEILNDDFDMSMRTLL